MNPLRPCLVALFTLGAATLAPSQTLSIDIHPTGDSEPRALVNAHGTLYFTADDGTHGRELWTSDGTAAGTTIVADLETGSVGSDPRTPVVIGTRLFCVVTLTAAGEELAAVDLVSGAVTVLDIEPGTAGSQPGTVVAHRGLAYFAATTAAAGRELWVSDGTVAGTQIVADLEPGATGADPMYLCPFQGLLYFQATTTTEGTELFRTDGTAAGTALALDLVPGAISGEPRFLTAFRDELFFQGGIASTGQELVAFDGTSSRIIDVWAGPGASKPSPGRSNSYPTGNGDRFAATRRAIFFRAFTPGTGIELFKYESGPDAELVKDLRPLSVGSEPYDLTVVGEKLFFSAHDGTAGVEPWVTLGTDASSHRITDLVPGPGSGFPENYTPLGSRRAILEAIVHRIGKELIITDGMLTRNIDLWPGATGSEASNLTAITGRVFFSGKHPTLGDELHVVDTGGMTLPGAPGCASDGTVPVLGGTDQVPGLPVTLRLSNVRPNQLSILAGGLPASAANLIDLGAGCILAVDFTLPVVQLFLPTGPTGGWERSRFITSNPSTIGATVALQVAVPGNPGQPPFDIDLSNSLTMTIGR